MLRDRSSFYFVRFSPICRLNFIEFMAERVALDSQVLDGILYIYVAEALRLTIAQTEL